MHKIALVEKLMYAYIILIILFNVLTLPFMDFIILQMIVSLIFITLLVITTSYIHSNRKIVWWALLLISILGIVRPFIEFLFSIEVPVLAREFFPPLTPLFSLVGFGIMITSLVLLLDPRVQKQFNND